MKEQKDIFSALFKLFNNYQASIDNCESKVSDYHSPTQLRQKFDFTIPDEGSSYNELLEDIKAYLTLSVKTSHKQFFNQLFGGNNLPAVMGEMTSSIANTSMYTYEMSPVATLMEMELVNKMCALMGFRNGEGILIPGGSLSNLQAMLCARNHYFPDSIENGLFNLPKITAFVSEEAHYSFDKAANILGLGTKQLVKVPTDDSGRMIPSVLEKLIKKSIYKNENPFFIGLTSGTTIKGAFDPITEIIPIAKKYNLWLHADGSWGGSAIFSQKHKHLLKGSEELDSFTWNPHKLMNIPLSCSALLLKEKGGLKNSLGNYNADYLFHENETQHYNLGQKSLQCGRKVDALKLWLSWKYYGDTGYEKRIDKLFELAKYTIQKIEVKREMQLMHEPSFLNICFRWNPNIDMDINKFNLELRDALIRNGGSMINYGYIREKVAIRLVLTNPDIEKKDIDQLFRNIQRTAYQLKDKYSEQLLV